MKQGVLRDAARPGATRHTRRRLWIAEPLCLATKNREVRQCLLVYYRSSDSIISVSTISNANNQIPVCPFYVYTVRAPWQTAL